MQQVICPICKADVRSDSKLSVCSSGHEFPVVGGIIDLTLNLFDKKLVEEEHYSDDVAVKGRMKISPDRHFYKKISEDYCSIFEQSIIKEWPEYRNKTVSIGELGCGSGSAIFYLRRIGFASVDYTGIDISMKMLQKGMKELMPANWRVQFVRSSANIAIFKENSLDILFSASALHHLDLSIAIEWISKALKPNGFFILHEPSIKNPFAKVGRKLIPDINTKGERPLAPEEVSHLASRYNLNLVDEKGLHFITGPLSFLVGIINAPKPIAMSLYYLARIVDYFVRSPSWNYSFIQIYKKVN